MAGELIFEKRGPVYTIEINCPDKHNFLSISLLAQLQNLVEAVQNDSEARVLVITEVGDKAFFSGFEISEIQGARAIKPGIEHDYSESALGAIRNFRLAVIAMVNGYAVGAGCDLVLNCDLRIASATARFGMGSAKYGGDVQRGGVVALYQYNRLCSLPPVLSMRIPRICLGGDKFV